MLKLAAIVAVTVSACLLLPFTVLGVLFFGPMVWATVRDRRA